MLIGSVMGNVTLDGCVPGAEGKRFAQVRCGELLLTALDPVGVRAGQQVLLLTGDGAAKLCPDVPADAAVLGIVGNNG
jgi:microcompartment protein CcmK/EutM